MYLRSVKVIDSNKILKIPKGLSEEKFAEQTIQWPQKER